jgi:translocation and assembly module TamB
VTIEQQVARDLTITYITNVTSTQQQVIQVEYNVNKNVSIVALRDQNGTFGLDVKFKKRFK